MPDAALSPASHASTEEGFHPRYSEQMRQRFNYEGVLEHKGASCDRAVLQVWFHLVIIMVNRASSDTFRIHFKALFLKNFQASLFYPRKNFFKDKFENFVCCYWHTFLITDYSDVTGEQYRWDHFQRVLLTETLNRNTDSQSNSICVVLLIIVSSNWGPITSCYQMFKLDTCEVGTYWDVKWTCIRITFKTYRVDQITAMWGCTVYTLECVCTVYVGKWCVLCSFQVPLRLHACL